MATRQEPGMLGRVYSLGGVEGQYGRGRQIDSNWEVFPGTTGRQILGSNSKRISALIQNDLTSTGNVTLGLGDITTGTEYTCQLRPGDSFQIDFNFPWTGVVGAVPSAACALWVSEISVP